MSAAQFGAAVAVLIAGALWCLAAAFRRAPRSLDAARRQMLGADFVAAPNVASSTASTSTTARAHRANGPLTQLVERQVGVGLAIIGQSIADVATRMVVSAAIVGVAVLAAVASLMAFGMLPMSPVWLALVVVAAAMAGWISLHDVRTKIERRRRDFRRAANDFVQLVAVGLTTDQSVEEAVRFALGVGVSDSFDELRDAIHTAPLRGVPLWEAIDEIGRRFDVRELCEFATSIERQGMQGVSISQTVGSLAAAMRAKALDELERDADRANANLSGPTIGFVVSTIVFLAYPLAQRITDAFGG